MERAQIVIINGVEIQKLVFLSLIIHLDSNGNIWTNVYYKPTNTHEYLHFKSHHPEHIKKNIPHVLAKRILILSTKEKDQKKNLSDLRVWLKHCGYPDSLIDKGIHTAKLQGPAPGDTTKALPLINTYYSNYDNKAVSTVASQLINSSKNERVQEAFKDVQFVQALKQPPNLLRTLSNSALIRNDNTIQPGVYKCNDKRCKICRLYLQDDLIFEMANGFLWNIRCPVSCNSLNVIYYLICLFCNKESYIGKTDDTRYRSNNHMSGCRLGTSSNIFDEHVYNCSGMALLTKEEKQAREPYFKLHLMMACSDFHKLIPYESKFHSLKMDTLNR